VLVNERDLSIFISGYPLTHAESGDDESANNKCVNEARQPAWF